MNQPTPDAERMNAVLEKVRPAITKQYRNMQGFRGLPAVMMVVHIRSFFGEILSRKDSWFAGYAQTTSEQDHCWVAMGLTLREFSLIWAKASQAKTPIAFGTVAIRDFVQRAKDDELPILFFHEERPTMTAATVNREVYA